MATHSRIPAWEIPWAEETGGLQSWAPRVGYNLATTQQHTASIQHTHICMYTHTHTHIFQYYVESLEKKMVTHSSILVWKIPWTEEPCRLQSMGSGRIGHD